MAADSLRFQLARLWRVNYAKAFVWAIEVLAGATACIYTLVSLFYNYDIEAVKVLKYVLYTLLLAQHRQSCVVIFGPSAVSVDIFFFTM